MYFSDVNKELLLGFVDESIDSLTAVDNLFVHLESNPSDIELVNAIFRPIHSLKGNAAYFGLMRLKKLAHSMENLLDMVRKKIRPVDRTVIDALLPGVDFLRKILTNVREDIPEIDNEKPYQKLINNIEILSGITNTSVPQDLVSSVHEILITLKSNCQTINHDVIENLVRILSSIPQLSKLSLHVDTQVGLKKSEIQQVIISVKELLVSRKMFQPNTEDANRIADLLSYLHQLSGSEHDRSIAEEMIDIFESFIASDAGFDELAISIVLEKLTLIKGDIPVQSNSEETRSEHIDTKQQIHSDNKTRHDKTMRIPETALDDFLRAVGELLGVEEMLRHLLRQLSEGIDRGQLFGSMKEAVTQFEEISRELRSQIMNIRKVEAKILLQKVPRIVRDIAVQGNKKINVVCIGEQVAIDKSYIDLLDAPLTHMVRNAADHGVETPEIRRNRGKDETGTISVSLIENSDLLKLIIEDDGAGLNYEGLRKKGIELGLVDETSKLTSADITDLLFHSGVSTANVVTDISGRGVGMDVVKRAVIETGGKIDVSSNPGAGTVFTVTLPRNASTQILDGYIVRSFSGEVYVLPLNNVVESFSIIPREVFDITGKGKVVNRRGTLNPIFVIDNLIGLHKEIVDIKAGFSGMGVLVETKNVSNVIAVKEIIGIQKVVSKRVDGGLLDITQFDGAAVSGTGQIYMIINIEKMFAML